jgi:putative Holliday junction resolvase
MSALLQGNTVMAFDWGLRHIGAAVGQRLIASSNPLTILKARDGVPHWQDIEKLLREWRPDLLVVGLPLNMDGTESPMSERASSFSRKLHGRFQLPVQLVDERLSSFAAKQARSEQHGNRDFGRDTVDAEAACIILLDYFNQSAPA